MAGTEYKSNEIGPLVAAAANAPVFSLYDVFLNHGEVGGYLSNLNEQGKVAGGMALRILRGEKPQDIPRVKGVNTYMFDWRAVKRWGLKESEIPPGSIILNRQPTVWESYKGYIIGGISLILLEALLISGLLWQRARRRKVETDLVVTNDRLRLALEADTRERAAFPPGGEHRAGNDLDVRCPANCATTSTRLARVHTAGPLKRNWATAGRRGCIRKT